MLEQAAIGDEDVIIPIVAECDDSFSTKTAGCKVQRDDVRAALAAARRPPRGAAHEGASGRAPG